MLEFALAIPVFLLLIFGIFEFGRLMLIYSSVFTASREAARYGSSVDTETGVARYLDCDGMRAAAIRVGFFAGLTPDDISVGYDTGAATPLVACDGSTSPALGGRVVVTVISSYQPVVPILQPVELSNTAARTVIRDIELGPESEGSPTEAPAVFTCTHLAIDIQDNNAGSIGFSVTNNYFTQVSVTGITATVTDPDGVEIPSTVGFGASVIGRYSTINGVVTLSDLNATVASVTVSVSVKPVGESTPRTCSGTKP